MSQPAPMLELERIETYRGPAQILRSISLTVGAGEAVCLVGRNGAGKTTTIDTIMGLLPARSGVVRFKGQEVTRVPAYERARMGIGYAPEDCGIFPDLSVEENFQITAWIGAGRVQRGPHRVEHIETMQDDQLPRFAAEGVVASQQAIHLQWMRPDLSDPWSSARI